MAWHLPPPATAAVLPAFAGACGTRGPTAYGGPRPRRACAGHRGARATLPRCDRPPSPERASPWPCTRGAVGAAGPRGRVRPPACDGGAPTAGWAPRLARCAAATPVRARGSGRSCRHAPPGARGADDPWASWSQRTTRLGDAVPRPGAPADRRPTGPWRAGGAPARPPVASLRPRGASLPRALHGGARRAGVRARPQRTAAGPVRPHSAPAHTATAPGAPGRGRRGRAARRRPPLGRPGLGRARAASGRQARDRQRPRAPLANAARRPRGHGQCRQRRAAHPVPRERAPHPPSTAPAEGAALPQRRAHPGGSRLAVLGAGLGGAPPRWGGAALLPRDGRRGGVAPADVPVLRWQPHHATGGHPWLGARGSRGGLPPDIGTGRGGMVAPVAAPIGCRPHPPDGHGGWPVVRAGGQAQVVSVQLRRHGTRTAHAVTGVTDPLEA